MEEFFQLGETVKKVILVVRKARNYFEGESSIPGLQRRLQEDNTAKAAGIMSAQYIFKAWASKRPL